MFEYTKNELGVKANEMNFVRDTLEKILHLTEILNYTVYKANSSVSIENRTVMRYNIVVNI